MLRVFVASFCGFCIYGCMIKVHMDAQLPWYTDWHGPLMYILKCACSLSFVECTYLIERLDSQIRLCSKLGVNMFLV